ncbi:hypothetical protein BDW02DRAFT_561373 [Decorospora gaudefroyi]|uniref:FAD-binding FR-type domain-containing protein n=1 Tax=Decorospora gaudefroyi TaxID=184978 RepID=A0A6A5JYC3_9PLEO|nr:hypothetical protein BDW02DRAFT_561373 [Decorospora gaudefroyi]
MIRSSQPIDKPTASNDTLDQTAPRLPVSSVSEDGDFDSNDSASSQCSCKHTVDQAQLNKPNNPRSPLLSHDSVESKLTRPLPTHLPDDVAPPPFRTIEEKNTSAKANVTTRGVPPASLLTAKTSLRQRFQRLCLHWFSAYRILIGLTFLINTIIVIILTRDNLSSPHFSLSGSLIATAAHIFAAVLVRQEDLINASFTIVAKTPCDLPLRLRKIIADLHHYGGFHIGCSMSALLWYFVFVFLNTKLFIDRAQEDKATVWIWIDISTSYAFLLAIFLVCVTAHPRFRVNFHNTFEYTHRFGGWAALLVLWINAGVSSHNKASTRMYANPAIWLLAATTFLIVLPWTRIRRVPVTTSAVSAREVKLSFPYKDMPYTATARFSLSPLMEWHAFATIPAGDESAYILISQAGDWTTSVIQSPPSHIYLRRPATQNFLSLTPLFNSLLLVATGAGIGPLLSLLQSPALAQMKRDGKVVRVMWCVYAPESAHWEFVQRIIRNVDSAPIIFDSRHGRPDMVFETQYWMERHDVEVVLVVSNPHVTRDVVEGVKSTGRAALGAVFDS